MVISHESDDGPADVTMAATAPVEVTSPASWESSGDSSTTDPAAAWPRASLRRGPAKTPGFSLFEARQRFDR